MVDPGACDIFTTVEQELPPLIYYTYKCGHCSEPAYRHVEVLLAHLMVVHNINARVVR